MVCPFTLLVAFRNISAVFAEFFAHPLFDANHTQQEIMVIDSEHRKNLLSDEWRQVRLLQSLANPEHAFHKFGTGNADTLGSAPGLRAQLSAFFSHYYSSNKMKLVMLSSLPAAELQRIVLAEYDGIPNKKLPLEDFGNMPQPYGQRELGKVVRVVPVLDTRELSLFFPLFPTRTMFRSKPLRYVAALIEDAGMGGLLRLLQDRQLVLKMGADVLEERDFSIL